jgi:hypothetical protein
MANLKYFDLKGIWRFDIEDLTPIDDVHWSFLPKRLKPGYYLHSELDNQALMVIEPDERYLVNRSTVISTLGKDYDIISRPTYPGRKMYEQYMGGLFQLIRPYLITGVVWRSMDLRDD